MVRFGVLLVSLSSALLAQEVDSAKSMVQVDTAQAQTAAPSQPVSLANSIIYMSKTYKTTLNIQSRYKNLELFVNDVSIGCGSRTVSGAPYGDCIIKGKLNGRLLYQGKETLDEGEDATVEVEAKNPYRNGLIYGIPALIGAVVMIPVIGTSGTGSSSSLMGMTVLHIVFDIVGIVGIVKEVKHVKWEKANRQYVNKLQIIE